jgi:hypothetical protein
MRKPAALQCADGEIRLRRSAIRRINAPNAIEQAAIKASRKSKLSGG